MGDVPQLRRELKELLVKRLRLRGVAAESIEDDAPLVQGPLGLDSIDILDLALAVEERFQLKLDDEEVGRAAFRSIAALAEFVEHSRTEAKEPESPGA